jgi:inner membrane protein
VPIGGIIASLPFARQRHAALAGILAYASHVLLDAATTYGTRLFWPFSRYRVGLDIISIIDPIFTLVMLIGVLAARKGRGRIVAVALTIAMVWLAAGFVQRERATAAQSRLAASRGDRIERAAVFPTLGNTIVWRSVYTSGGMLRIDRIRAGWFANATYAPVTTVPLVSNDDIPDDVRARRDFARFAWFSDGWTARDPSDATVIGDARYSLSATRWQPVWGIRLAPTEWVNRTRDREVSLGALWKEMRGIEAGFRPVP